MMFNVGKCKTVIVGFNNENNIYRLAEEDIENVNTEKDLGVSQVNI